VRLGAGARLVRGPDVDRAAPVLRSFGGLEPTVFPLSVPVLDVHLLDSAVEILDLDGAVIVVECNDFEQRTAVQAIPVADSRLRSRHRRPPPAKTPLN